MSFCPHCGYNLTRDDVIERDGFMLDPRGSVTFEGRPVRVSKMQAGIMHSLASEKGRTIKADVLVERVGSVADNPENLVSVLMTRAKHALADVDAPVPVRNVWGRGWRWGMQ